MSSIGAPSSEVRGRKRINPNHSQSYNLEELKQLHQEAQENLASNIEEQFQNIGKQGYKFDEQRRSISIEPVDEEETRDK